MHRLRSNCSYSAKKDPNDLTPNEIRLEAEAFAKREVQKQLNEFRQLGIMADWGLETTYRTLGPSSLLSSAFRFHGFDVK